MRFSFSIRAADGAAAKAAVAQKLAEVVAEQPMHAAFHDQALATAGALIDLVPDADAWDSWGLMVEMDGSRSGGADELGTQLVDPTGADFRVKVYRLKASA